MRDAERQEPIKRERFHRYLIRHTAMIDIALQPVLKPRAIAERGGEVEMLACAA